MSRLTPRMQEIQRRYADDQMKQNQAMQDLYKEEGVSMGGGCLWSFVPMLILIPLYTVVRQPIVYMLHENLDTANQIIEIIKSADPSLFTKNAFYDQMVAARYIPEYLDAIKAAIPGLGELAASEILRLMNREPGQLVTIPGNLIIRQSCAFHKA